MASILPRPPCVNILVSQKLNIVPILVHYISVCTQVCVEQVYSMTRIFRLIVQNISFNIHSEIALRWMPQNWTNTKSTFEPMLTQLYGAIWHRWATMS